MISFITLFYTAESSAYRNQEIKNLTALTKIPHLALSTSYLEQRIFYYEDYSDILYPQMIRANKMEYVYVK